LFIGTEIEIEIEISTGSVGNHWTRGPPYIEDHMPLDPVEIDFNSSVLGGNHEDQWANKTSE
jgi:hypothetical protein